MAIGSLATGITTVFLSPAATLDSAVGHLVARVVAPGNRIAAVRTRSAQPQQSLYRAAHDEAKFLFR